MKRVTHFLPLLSLASVSHLCKETPSDTALSLGVGLGKGLWALAGALSPLVKSPMPFGMPRWLATWTPGSHHLQSRYRAFVLQLACSPQCLH